MAVTIPGPLVLLDQTRSQLEQVEINIKEEEWFHALLAMARATASLATLARLLQAKSIEKDRLR